MLHVDLFSVYLAVIASGLALSLVWLVVARTFPTLYAPPRPTIRRYDALLQAVAERSVDPLATRAGRRLR